ncbi:MAG: ribonuclease R [Calditrichaeota bacterium]|nr:ribonuclease R [Calditrichota bacterium]
MSIEDQLIQLFEKYPERYYKPKQLGKILKIDDRQYPAFKRKLKKLAEQGIITRHKKGKIGQGLRSYEVEGILHVKTQGYGFLITDDDKADIFISQKNMGMAFHGDRVRALLFARLRGKNQEGKVVEVLQRAHNNFVGTFRQGKYWGTVVPDNLKIHRTLYIAPEKQNGAQDGQKVVAQLLEWTDERQNPTGEIVEILGRPGDPGIDVLSIARSFDLPDIFPKKIIKEAEAIPDEIPQSEIKRRLDWRKELTFTIDPVDSKDFDDAISLKILDNGHYLLGVHIADVSYYVAPETELDRESRNRSTSVYLVDRVIPMFPERLSNEICSLKQGVDRLTFSVLIEMAKDGSVIKYDIQQSIIDSDRRFTYEEIQDLIDGKITDAKFQGTILEMFRLSKKLIQKRQERGSLDFGSHEVRIKLDDEGKPVDIVRVYQLDSHRLIEEFMVLANSIVARHVDKILKEKTGFDLPFPYRVHEKPGGEKLKDFRRFLKALGINFKSTSRVTPRMFQDLQQSLEGNERKLLVEEIMVRSMMKAKYTTKNEGHFGLALKYYTHFTSPIRRYPDLMVHRLLKQYLKDANKIPLPAEKLEKICSHATDMEIRAMEVERASVKTKQLEFMQDKVGQTFQGIISGVTSFGIFVELSDYLIEGLVHITTLDDDYYNFDEARYLLFGAYQGKTYQLGDPVTVKVLLVNPEEKIIDFELVEILKEDPYRYK